MVENEIVYGSIEYVECCWVGQCENFVVGYVEEVEDDVGGWFEDDQLWIEQCQCGGVEDLQWVGQGQCDGEFW